MLTDYNPNPPTIVIIQYLQIIIQEHALSNIWVVANIFKREKNQNLALRILIWSKFYLKNRGN